MKAKAKQPYQLLFLGGGKRKDLVLDKLYEESISAMTKKKPRNPL